MNFKESFFFNIIKHSINTYNDQDNDNLFRGLSGKDILCCIIHRIMY